MRPQDLVLKHRRIGTQTTFAFQGKRALASEMLSNVVVPKAAHWRWREILGENQGTAARAGLGLGLITVSGRPTMLA